MTLTVLLFFIYLFLLMLVLDASILDYFCADWDSPCDHLREVPWEDTLKLSASAAAREFC